jgi:hypothetical protein
MKQPIGARYEIAIDGKPRSYRDQEPIALEAARLLKRKNLNAEVIVRDVEGGAATVITSRDAQSSG